MIQSMTGYSRVARRKPRGTIVVELRSTNHRYLEIDQRLPDWMASLGGRISSVIREKIQRGRIDLVVTLHGDDFRQRKVTFDEAVLAQYHQALRTLRKRFGIKDTINLAHLLALPRALAVVEEPPESDRVWNSLRQTLRAAVAELVSARRQEGARLLRDLRRQIRTIEQNLQAIRRQLPKAANRQRAALRQRLKTLLAAKTPMTVAQREEILALVKASDIHEELVRLESHVHHVRQTIATKRSVGKTLDFIAQELMREANTMGAKSDDSQIARHVVEIKGAIEKIREEVQNLE